METFIFIGKIISWGLAYMAFVIFDLFTTDFDDDDIEDYFL
jgi:hypothetical protein